MTLCRSRSKSERSRRNWQKRLGFGHSSIVHLSLLSLYSSVLAQHGFYRFGFPSGATSPFNTSRNSFSASSANRSMFFARSDDLVSTSRVATPSSETTASATYPLWQAMSMTLYPTSGSNKHLRSSILGVTPSRTCSPRLADGIGGSQGFLRMLRQTSDNLRCRASSERKYRVNNLKLFLKIHSLTDNPSRFPLSTLQMRSVKAMCTQLCRLYNTHSRLARIVESQRSDLHTLFLLLRRFACGRTICWQ